MNAAKTENQGAGIGNREVQPEIREAEIENLPADQGKLIVYDGLFSDIEV